MDFESDCEQLVELINREEDWPAMAVELDEIKAYATRFMEFSILFILRALNVRADGDVPRRIGSSVPTWSSLDG